MAKLTEQEQQKVIRFIEVGRPLPDKYRFLLFLTTSARWNCPGTAKPTR